MSSTPSRRDNSRDIMKLIDGKVSFLERLSEGGYSVNDIADEIILMLNNDKYAREYIKDCDTMEQVSPIMKLNLVKPSERLKMLALILKASGIIGPIASRVDLNNISTESVNIVVSEEEANALKEARDREKINI